MKQSDFAINVNRNEVKILLRHWGYVVQKYRKYLTEPNRSLDLDNVFVSPEELSSFR